MQYDGGHIYQLGHGFTRGGTAHCVVKSALDHVVRREFDVNVLGDSEFSVFYSPPERSGSYLLQCRDMTTGISSNEVRYSIFGLPGQCSCDIDHDGHAPPDCFEIACPVRDDCDDNNSNVHPGQPENCGDGVDNDCNPATPDACPVPSCPSGSGLYCGSAALGQNSGWLYQCAAGVYTLASNCQGLGCVVHPPGQNDSCQQPPQNTCNDHVCSTPAETCSSCPSDCCLGVPALLSPALGATLPDTAPVQFRWSAVATAGSYRVTVCRDANLTTNCTPYVTPGPQTTLSALPPITGILYWSAQARPVDVAAGWSPMAPAWSFVLSHVAGCTSNCTPLSHRCANAVEESCIEVAPSCYQFGAATPCPFGNACRDQFECNIDHPPVCNDGMIQTGEQCDQNVVPSTCVFEGFDQGILGCTGTCTFDTSQCCRNDPGCEVAGATSCNGGEQQTCEVSGLGGCLHWTAPAQCPNNACSGSTCAAAACGNGFREGGEVCDGNALGGGTCAGQGFDQGTLGCTGLCAYDTSQCCRNDVGCDAVGATRCDAGAQQTCQVSGPGGCRHWTAPAQCPNNACSGDTCAAAACGNGFREGGEVCDGNALGGGTCAGQGFDQGALGCTGLCAYDTSQCCRHDAGCDVVGATRCNAGSQQTCQVSGAGGCRHWSAAVPCANNACAGNVCAASVCGNGVIEAGEACDGNAIGGATCGGEGFDSGTLRCDTQCQLDPTSCCLNSCPQQWATQCESASSELECNDYNNDGCVEWGGHYTCPCAGGVCAVDCFPFTVTLPAGTNATTISFWPAAGPALALVDASAGGAFPSPAGACSATLDYVGRWNSWIAVPRTFPAGAPQGSAALTYPGAGTVGFCELQVGEASWGVAHDGLCHQ